MYACMKYTAEHSDNSVSIRPAHLLSKPIMIEIMSMTPLDALLIIPALDVQMIHGLHLNQRAGRAGSWVRFVHPRTVNGNTRLCALSMSV